MINELKTLESKIGQVASLCRALREENAALKAQLAEAEQKRQDLSERMASARGRLEHLVQQLPESKIPPQ